MIIAIDGLAGSGKSSTAKLVAKRLSFSYFTTGKMYRAITKYVIINDIVNDLPESLDKIIDTINISVKGSNFDEIIINNKDYSDGLYSEKINNHISIISSMPSVRFKMVKIQREVANNNNIVCEGRDIGTVVFPDADYKFYFKADLKSRTDRRYLEIKQKNPTITKSILRNRIKTRDYKDLNREESPLKRANDAILVITTNMTIKEQVSFICNIVNKNKKGII
tara:strand:+ start:2009 stop:2677 length:669 start_codon:yes stop_codon:yes gene_type:complete